MKRVIGLPGDKIAYEDGKLYVNGSLIEETFLEKTSGDFTDYMRINDFTLQDITGKETVPPGMIFVIGDNRLGSYDSRHFGFIGIDKVVGKVNLRYYQFHHNRHFLLDPYQGFFLWPKNTITSAQLIC